MNGGQRLEDIINIEGYKWVQNVAQRRKNGGKPALLINEEMFYIKEVCPDLITVPIGVEACWAVLTPKSDLSQSKMKYIAVASLYYTVATKRSEFLDHISEAYHTLCAKYGSNLKFIISGDFNRLKYKPILNLSADLKQVVTIPTRLNPDAILDLIFTNLHSYYHLPTTLPPLSNDEGNNGSPSDHLPVLMEPISNVNPSQTKRYKVITYRPFPDSGIREMGQWIQAQSWKEIYRLSSAHDKAEKFENMLMEKVELFFPEKTIKVNENDKPWMNPELVKLDRKRKKEYNRNMKSTKWKELNSKFEERASEAKNLYYKNMVEDLKTSKPGQWYSKIKRMSASDPTVSDLINVEELEGLSSKEQVEVIADEFGKISNMYEPLNKGDIKFNCQNQKSYPLFEPMEIYNKIRKMKKKSSVKGDVPWKIITEFSVELSFPLSNIYNTGTENGEWPAIWKFEYVTPVPKVYPPNSVDDLRKISGTKKFSKIYEALLSDTIIGDITPSIDPSQYGQQKGLSIQHYLVKMVNRILTILDTNNENEKYAVLSKLIDWRKAFDMQDPKKGIMSFIKCGVRGSLVPILINYFQDRKMVVKWNKHLSTVRDLPGGGPQGCTFGGLEYLVNSNDNTEHIPADMKFKFVDDLSTLEKLNLILLGLSSYNFHNHVASDVGVEQKYLASENFSGQSDLNKIIQWTEENKMELNSKKSKVMIFNFTKDYQFSTRLYMNNTLLEIIEETKLLGTIISTDLKWYSNTEMLTKKGYQRMIILHKLFEFNVPDSEMVIIYTLFIRSILEQSCVVWHYDLTQEETSDLERVQKVACKVILKDRYTSYEMALDTLKLKNLKSRREDLCLRFAKNALKLEKTKTMFPLNANPMSKEKYVVQFASTSRLKDSSIPQMQRALNADTRKK